MMRPRQSNGGSAYVTVHPGAPISCAGPCPMSRPVRNYSDTSRLPADPERAPPEMGQYKDRPATGALLSLSVAADVGTTSRINSSVALKRQNSSGRPTTSSGPAYATRQAGELLAAGHLQAALELHHQEGGQESSTSPGGAAANKLAAAGSLSSDQLAALLRKAMASPSGAMMHKRVATEYNRKYGTSGGILGGPQGPQRRWSSGEVATAPSREVLSQLKIDAPVNSSLFAQINSQRLAQSRPSTQSRSLGKQVGLSSGSQQQSGGRPGSSSAPKPHRAVPYKPGMVVMPPSTPPLQTRSGGMSSSMPASSVSAINNRPPTSSGRLPSRPSTSNPITHTLISQPPATPSYNSSSSAGRKPSMGNETEERVAVPNFFRSGQASMGVQRKVQTAGAAALIHSYSASRPGAASSSYGLQPRPVTTASPSGAASANATSSSPQRSRSADKHVVSDLSISNTLADRDSSPWHGEAGPSGSNPASFVLEGQQPIDHACEPSNASIQQTSAHGDFPDTMATTPGHLGLPPRPPGTGQLLNPSYLATPSGTVPSTPSLRPNTAASDFSTAGLALGRQGLGGMASRSNLGSSCGSVLEGRPESACADSVDLCLARLKAENNTNNTLSINILSQGDADEMDTLSLSDFGIKGGPSTPWMAPKPKQRAVGLTKTAALLRASKWKTQQALLKQAAPMVLSLENMVDSTPEVLEMELGRMSLDELLDLDARVHVTAASNSRKRT
eukprot:gene14978-21036_t